MKHHKQSSVIFFFSPPPKLLAGSEANPAGSENHPAARRHSQLAPIPSAGSLLLPAGSLPHPVGSEPLYGSEALPAFFKAFPTGSQSLLRPIHLVAPSNSSKALPALPEALHASMAPFQASCIGLPPFRGHCPISTKLLPSYHEIHLQLIN